MFQRTVVSVGLLVLLFLTGCSIITGSGNVITDERPVDGFDSIDLSTAGDLTIIQDERTSLVLKGEDNIIERVETIVRGNRLIIRNRSRGIMTLFRNTRPIEIIVSTPTLEDVSVSGAGDIYAEALKTDKLEISISGAGDIQIDELESERIDVKISGAGDFDINELTTDVLELEISGAGDIDLAGRANRADFTVNGAGDITADDLRVDVADIRVSGAGSVDAWVRETLDVRISGIGGVNYYGNPQVEQSISGMGDVESLGDKE
ncbi:MAG: head GIN domain-containing protein [Chloroflexota bacterium]